MTTADNTTTLATYRKQFAGIIEKMEKTEAAYLERLTAFHQAEKRLKVAEGQLRLATAQVTTLAKIFVTSGDEGGNQPQRREIDHVTAMGKGHSAGDEPAHADRAAGLRGRAPAGSP